MSLTKEIQKAVGKMQVLKFHNPVCENIGALNFDIEMDVMSISKAKLIYEFEIKISESDFKADAKKRKWQYYLVEGYEKFTPNYFSYVCPKGLISLVDIPEFAGLYYFDCGELTEIRKPKRIHKAKCNKNHIIEKVSRITSERHFLGCSRLTYENNLIKERNNSVSALKNK
jgi:ssDNA-binding Zn-finger/Zn-ribbon topoisomerase 1